MKIFLYTLLFFFLVMQICFAQWFWQNPLPQGNWLSSVCFVDENIGTAVGEDGTILRTSDGGSTWNSQLSGTTTFLNDVFFIDAKYPFLLYKQKHFATLIR